MKIETRIANRKGRIEWLDYLGGAVCLVFANLLAFDIGEKLLAKKYLSFLRQNSLLLFPLHVIILRITAMVIPMTDWNMWLSAVIRLIIIHILIVPCCYVINRYMPILAGRGIQR